MASTPDPTLLTPAALAVDLLGNQLTLAAAALYIYDVLLTLPAEIALVWPLLSRSASKRRRPWFALTVYFLGRYGLLIQAVLGSMVDLFAPSLPFGWCVSWNYASNWSIPAVLMLNEAMLIIRVSALYLNSWRIRYPLWALYLACSACTAVFTGLGLDGTYSYLPPPGTISACLLGGGQTLFWAIWLPPFPLELVIFSLSLYKIVQHWKAGSASRLLSVMARDGFLYFTLITALLLVNLILCLTTSVVYYAMLEEFTLCLTSSTCTRLYLNLRLVARAHERAYAVETELTPPWSGGPARVEEGGGEGGTKTVVGDGTWGSGEVNYNDLTTTFWSDYGEE